MSLQNDSKTGVILDTDIGYDADDFFALVILLNSPEFNLDLIITGDEVGGKRAALVKKILHLYNRSDIPVVQGADLQNSNFVMDEFISDVSLPSGPENLIGGIESVINRFEKIVYIGIDGFTNLSNLIKRNPSFVEKLRIIQMGGAINFSRHPGWVEHNVRIDIPSAIHVISSGADLSLIMAKTTMQLEYQLVGTHPIVEKLKRSQNPIHQLLWKNLYLFHQKLAHKKIEVPWSYAHDPLTVSVALGKKFVDFEEKKILMNESGIMSYNPQGFLVKVAKEKTRAKEFMKFLENRL